jgi:hypothetical protein
MIDVRDIMNCNWRDYFAPIGAVGMGLDIATTAQAKSNPSGLALTQEVDGGYAVRFVVRYKTADPEVTTLLIRHIAGTMPHNLRVRKLCADATNERFFVAQLKAKLAGQLVVEGVVGGENIVVRGEKMSKKALRCNLLINAVEDGRLALPNEKWLERDLRQPKRAGGTFETDVDADGNHGDAFDGISLSLMALYREGGGVAEAVAAAVGGFGSPQQMPSKNPLLRAAQSVRRLFF